MTYIGLDATQYERSIGTGENTPLPAGFYQGTISRANLKDNKPTAKDPNGKYLEVEFDINLPEEFNNRKFWDKFNIINSNATAVKIGKEQLADLVQALGMTNLGEADDLIGRACSFVLKVDPAKPPYGASNACLKYLSSNATQADYETWLASKKGGAKTATVAQAAAPASAAAKPAWKK